MLTIEDSGFAAFGHAACLPGTGPNEKRAKALRRATWSAPL
jgi:hypothetical protein